ncbi:hypothetical protein QN382_12475 [Pseudomonas sp. 10B1]|uniref:hypothetical protein n=1 Tax=unclassified Pseudomonas TaxID=196821 RepID=UPI002B223BAB|nr:MULTISPECIES: hypothetical protein [unclassified Pseudomonas]MEA9996300.1 hypothetical protein [Pseudomonas sp. AA4]MEB0086658.1 hypothetical protein [Pseudomonas sp. RTI1]MEB0124708.1 hypothetical protein [Pseudomonas sp. CCC1.2]MEB0154972.1 hypothetical protein [Pseudomonas sp. CCC4.3]MEB0217919.1 hypothetical protein [Pseudomonas sp. AB12(2023)]
MGKAKTYEQKRDLPHSDASSRVNAPTKISRVLTYLVNDGSLMRFEAERLGDHCLHSTISSLANGYGLKFERVLEQVPNHWGEDCTVTRYTLPVSERKRARIVLKMMRLASGARREVAA